MFKYIFWKFRNFFYISDLTLEPYIIIHNSHIYTHMSSSHMLYLNYANWDHISYLGKEGSILAETRRPLFCHVTIK